MNVTVRPVDIWPGPKTAHRIRSPFKAGWSSTVELLDREIRALDGKRAVLLGYFTENQLRLDGWVRGDAYPSDPGVVLALETRFGPLKYPCDAFTDWKDNIRAIALGLEALRKVDRYGIAKRGEQYTGYRALPAGAPVDPWGIVADVLGITVETLKAGPFAQYRKEALRVAHPDTGGDGETFARVKGALDVISRDQ